MDILIIILTGLAVSMDNLAVSISSGIVLKNIRMGDAIKVASFFGFFQALMPLIGWSVGVSVKKFVAGFGLWPAFGIYVLIGLKMIYESLKPLETKKNFDPLNSHVLLVLSIITSIDALAIGLTFSFLNVSILPAAILIGCVTFIVSLLGALTGSRLAAHCGNKPELIGGLIILGLAGKILLNH